jgi:hypothetical protein
MHTTARFGGPSPLRPNGQPTRLESLAYPSVHDRRAAVRRTWSRAAPLKKKVTPASSHASRRSLGDSAPTNFRRVRDRTRAADGLAQAVLIVKVRSPWYRRPS